METSFTELRNKEVINVLSGRLLGNVNDVILDFRCNNILGIVVPGSRSFFNFFKPCQEIFIPICSICKIGEDVILVEVVETQSKKQRKRNAKTCITNTEEEMCDEHICSCHDSHKNN